MLLSSQTYYHSYLSINPLMLVGRLVWLTFILFYYPHIDYPSIHSVDTWDKCSNAFIVKFFPMGKTNALCNKISSFTQQGEESNLDAWERMQECITACPHHGMEDWLFIQNFNHGLVPLNRSHLDAAAGGAFFSLSVADAKALTEKMLSNQRWNDERLQPRKRGMHSLKYSVLVQIFPTKGVQSLQYNSPNF